MEAYTCSGCTPTPEEPMGYPSAYTSAMLKELGYAMGYCDGDGEICYHTSDCSGSDLCYNGLEYNNISLSSCLGLSCQTGQRNAIYAGYEWNGMTSHSPDICKSVEMGNCTANCPILQAYINVQCSCSHHDGWEVGQLPYAANDFPLPKTFRKDKYLWEHYCCGESSCTAKIEDFYSLAFNITDGQAKAMLNLGCQCGYLNPNGHNHTIYNASGDQVSGSKIHREKLDYGVSSEICDNKLCLEATAEYEFYWNDKELTERQWKKQYETNCSRSIYGKPSNQWKSSAKHCGGGDSSVYGIPIWAWILVIIGPALCCCGIIAGIRVLLKKRKQWLARKDPFSDTIGEDPNQVGAFPNNFHGAPSGGAFPEAQVVEPANVKLGMPEATATAVPSADL